MTTLYDHYQTLGVSIGAGIADITSSYKRLCREHHPDINDDPTSEELMKKINIAYTILREKFRREAAFRDRQFYSRPIRTRRYSNPDTQTHYEEPKKASPDTEAEAELKALHVMNGYFTAISACDYSGAYSFLSSYDKKHITQECFIEWRKSVARLYPMREFRVTGGLPSVKIKFNGDKSMYARRFSVAVTEDDLTDDSVYSGVIEKLATSENGTWKVFLGYNSVSELTRTFNERHEAKRKRSITKHWMEYCEEQYPEYNMLSIHGMRKTAQNEIYRQKRFGGSITFAAISITAAGAKRNGQEELLQSASRTISNALRETDIPAYAGDGVFAILFVELRKKNAEDIIKRLIERIRQKAGTHLGKNAIIEFSLNTWAGNDFANVDAFNKVLARFRKKM